MPMQGRALPPVLGDPELLEAFDEVEASESPSCSSLQRYLAKVTRAGGLRSTLRGRCRRRPFWPISSGWLTLPNDPTGPGAAGARP